MGRRLLAGAAVGAILLAGAACSDDDGDDGEDAATTESTTEAAGEDGEATTEAEGTDGSTPAEDETSTTVDDLAIGDIRAYLEDEHPDEAALVDWDIIRWVSGFGYTATVPQGTGYDEAVAVCDALSEIVHQHSEDAIAVVAAPDEAPLADRDGPDDTCSPSV